MNTKIITNDTCKSRQEVNEFLASRGIVMVHGKLITLAGVRIDGHVEKFSKFYHITLIEK